MELERVLHVLRGHDLVVVEADALAELELPLGVRERLPGGSERGLEFQLGVPVQQGIEHVDVDEDAHPLEVHVRIEHNPIPRGRCPRRKGSRQKKRGRSHERPPVKCCPV